MKRSLTGIIAATMVLGSAIPAAFASATSTTPNDISGSQYATAISMLVNMGTQGDASNPEALNLYADGSFRPTLGVSRGQFIAYVYNVLKEQQVITKDYNQSTQPYGDEDNYFRNQINDMYLYGFLNNLDLGNGAIGENYKTPAWWASQLLCNVAGISYDSSKPYDALNQARKQGWFANTPDEKTNPNYYLDRGEMAQVLLNFYAQQYPDAFKGMVATDSLTAASATTGVGQGVQLTVAAKDLSGSAITLDSSHTVTYNVYNADGTVNNNGVVNASGLFVGTASGAYNVTATVDGITSNSVQIAVAGAAAGLQLSAATPTLVANGSSTDQVTAKVIDAKGNPVTNFSGTVNVTDANGQLVNSAGSTTSNLPNVTVANGVATFTVKATNVIGASDSITVSGLTGTNAATPVVDANGNSVTATLSLSQIAQVATSLSVTPSSKTVENNVASPDAFTVQVLDQSGQPMLTGTYPVTLSVSGPGSFSTNTMTSTAYVGNGTSTVTVPGGVVSQQGVPGTIQVLASSPGLTTGSANIQSLTVGAPVGLKLGVDSSSSSSFAANSGNSVFDISTVDANGNTVIDPSIPTFTASVWQGSTQVTSGVSAVVGSNSNGQPTVTITGTAAGSYTLKVTSSDNLTAATSAFSITSGTGSTVSITAPANDIQLPVSSDSYTIQAQLKDGAGNAVAQAGVPVEFTVGTVTGGDTATLGGSTTGRATAITNSNGVASISFVGSHTIGDVWSVGIDKVNNAPASAPSVNVKMVGGVPSTVSVGLKDTTAANSSYQNNTAYAQAGDTVTVTVAATDSFGNPSTNADVVQVTLPAGLSNPLFGVLTETNPSTGVYDITMPAGGSAQFTATAWTQGSAQVKAQDLTVGSATVSGTGSMTILPGGAGGFAFFNSSNQEITSSNELAVSANTPTAVWLKPVDLAGNPIVEGNTSAYVTVADGGYAGNFRTNASNGSVSVVTVPAGSSGVPMYYINGVGGSYDLTANGGGTVLNTATRAVLSVASSSVASGSTDNATITLYDANGNVVPYATTTAQAITLTKGVGSGSGTVTAPATVNFSNGVATVALTGAVAGAETLTAAFNGLNTNPVQVTTGVGTVSASTSTVTMSSFTAFVAGPPVANGSGTLTVVLKDAGGNAISGQSASLTGTTAPATGISVGAFTESTSTPGTYTATVTSTANNTGATVTVKDGTTSVGTSGTFNS